MAFFIRIRRNFPVKEAFPDYKLRFIDESLKKQGIGIHSEHVGDGVVFYFNDIENAKAFREIFVKVVQNLTPIAPGDPLPEHYMQIIASYDETQNLTFSIDPTAYLGWAETAFSIFL